MSPFLARLASPWRRIDFRGETFSTSFCFAVSALVKLCSSVILTRLLYPEAYGIVAMLSSVVFIMEMLSDIGILGLLIRHERKDDAFLDTLWTIRLARGCLNAVLLCLLAPWIAKLYGTPELVNGLRLFALTFVAHALQSMAFLIALREQRARLVNYAELGCSIVTTVFVLVYSWFSRDHYGMVFGVVLNSVLMLVLSYVVTGARVPRFHYDRATAKDLFGFARFVGPSSAITLLLNQYEKLVQLKLFDLQQLGLYGIASSITAPVEGLISRLSRVVLYPRCAENNRTQRESSRELYYRQNVKIFLIMLALPACVAGGAEVIVRVLFDPRYYGAAVILQALCLRSILSALASPAEDVLVAAGHARVVLVGNCLRLVWLVAASLIGYKFFGFVGFIYGAATDLVPALIYLWWKQNASELLVMKFEAARMGFAAAAFGLSLAATLGVRQLFTHGAISG